MATATTHIESAPGYAGFTRVFHLDPPVQFDDGPAAYVAVSITPAFGAMSAEVRTYAATANGAVRGHTMHRRPGSFPLFETPTDEAYIRGCWFLALQMLGGYQHAAELPDLPEVTA